MSALKRTRTDFFRVRTGQTFRGHRGKVSALGTQSMSVLNQRVLVILVVLYLPGESALSNVWRKTMQKFDMTLGSFIPLVPVASPSHTERQQKSRRELT